MEHFIVDHHPQGVVPLVQTLKETSVDMVTKLGILKLNGNAA